MKTAGYPFVPLPERAWAFLSGCSVQVRKKRLLWVRRAVVSALLAGSLAGCTSLRYGGAPEPSFNVDKDLEQLAKQYGESITIAEF